MSPKDSFAGLDAQDRCAREEILHRAYEIWEHNGRPENRAMEHWVQAEQEILRPL